MMQPITREELKEDLKVFSKNIKEGFREEFRENTREIIGHFNKSQAIQNKQLGEMKEQLGAIGEDVAKVKLAVLDLMAMDRHLHNLVRELQRQGIALDMEKIFAT